jgi:uncharacterized membrane protein
MVGALTFIGCVLVYLGVLVVCSFHHEMKTSRAAKMQAVKVSE